MEEALEIINRFENLMNNPVTADITIVTLTALAMNGDEKKFKEAVCSGYILKSIEVHKLQ
ncbi:MAG: hypothetical protein KAJ93_08195 [Methanosarcinales archaeon]|nr:hypothetical protein [Methanosarcinales archaeon]